MPQPGVGECSGGDAGLRFVDRRSPVGLRSAADGREVSLGQEVRHQLIEVVWAFQWQHV